MNTHHDGQVNPLPRATTCGKEFQRCKRWNLIIYADEMTAQVPGRSPLPAAEPQPKGNWAEFGEIGRGRG